MMCGIAGIIGPMASGQKLSHMLDRLHHRGPDDRGRSVEPGLAFGMTRLSIVDLSSGAQPQWYGEEIAIVFNGEIYNFKDLRKSLNYDFKTDSDTEVILKAYHAYGIEFIEKLNGMFSIFIYDRRIGKIFLIRDRLGIKPLYYCVNGNCLYFASEIKAIISALDGLPGIDPKALSYYLGINCVPGPYTIWDSMQKLMPGRYLEFDLGSSTFQIKQYWSVEYVSETDNPDTNYLAEYESKFADAVQKRFTSADVPVGSFLSGGIDSSIISSTIRELGFRDFHTFTIGFEQNADDGEFEHAQAVAKHIGSIHHETKITQRDFLEFLPKFVDFADEPMGDLACFPLYFISRKARSHVKVMLTGDGADEVFAGYFLNNLYPRLGSWIANSSYIPKRFSDSEIKNMCGRAAFSIDDFLSELYAKSTSADDLDKWCNAHIGPWLSDNLLMKTDKMSMACSLEVRVPFLDHNLVEWAARLPVAQKLGHDIDTTKKILRDYAVGRIPRNIIDRPKRGFDVPIELWMQQPEFQTWIVDCLNGRELNELLNIEPMKQTLMTEAFRGNKLAGCKIWLLVILQKWLKHWT